MGKKRRQCLTIIGILTVFVATYTAVLAFERENPDLIRSRARWLLWSRDYKSEVLARPDPPEGELKGIGWDGWGLGSLSADVALFFDPTDSLAAKGARFHGKVPGEQCPVESVYRLESHWYAVVQWWGDCPAE